MTKNKTNFAKKFLSALMAMIIAITAMTTIAYAADFPKEAETISIVTYNDEENLIEDIDPNIIVTVTKLDNPPIMPRSFYSSYFDFSGSLYGKYRYFDGNHLGAEGTSYSEMSGKNFTLKLVRKTALGGTVVAKASIPQNGSFHVDFTNVYNPNDYRFAFEQEFMGSCHQWGDINMFSWN